MKTLKLLNKEFFLIIIFFLLSTFLNAEEQPVDIWNVDKKKANEVPQSNDFNLENIDGNETKSENSIYEMQSIKKKRYYRVRSIHCIKRYKNSWTLRSRG